MKEIDFVGSSFDDLKSFPKEVMNKVGYLLREAQKGNPIPAKPLRGFGGAGVLEIIEDYSGNTYRAVYTVKFADIIYVLHCFQKKSKSGIKTPEHEIHLVKQRLKWAEVLYKLL